MPKPYSGAIITLLFLLLTISTSYSEEIDNLRIPLEEENQKETYQYTFILKSPVEAEPSALLHLTSSQTRKLQTHILNQKLSLSLSAGKYSAIIDAGPRILPQRLSFTLPADKDQSQIIELKPFVRVEPIGWIMLDTFSNPQTGVSASSLKQRGAARRLRGIFTTLPTLQPASRIYTTNHQKTQTTLFPARSYLHKTSGELLTYPATDSQLPTTSPEITTTPIFKLLARLQDNNNLTALSPLIYYNTTSKPLSGPAAEFIFDTITGPLYNLFILADFSASLKLWYVLLNQGYRIPAIYLGGNNLLRNTDYPSLKMYAKVPRKEYSQKLIHTALKNGQSILSNGPFIRLFVESIGSKAQPHQTGLDNTEWINGHSLKIGDLGFTSDNYRNIYIEAFSSSSPDDYIKTIELIYNGKIVGKKVGAEYSKNLLTTIKVMLNQPGWIQLRYTSTTGKYHALTNPIYIIDQNTQSPTPALASCKVNVLSAQTGQPLNAELIIENFGITINKVVLSQQPLTIQLPATANIRVEAKDYIPQEKNLYLDGGAAEYIHNLRQKKLLYKAMNNQISYKYLRKALLNSQLTFKLTPQKK